MKKILYGSVLVIVGLFSQPLLAFHQPGPNINCVAVVYDDLTFDNVPWADVRQLDPGPMIELRILHDLGASGGPGATVFTGSIAYAIFVREDDILVIAFNPSIAGTGTSKLRVFRGSGSQSKTVTRATGLANMASAASTREFTSINVQGMTNGQSFADNQADAAAVDVGLCSPDP